MQASNNDEYVIDPRNVRAAFDAAAEDYDAYSILQRTITDRLLESFEHIKIAPKRILDLGSGTGYGSLALKQKFNKAHVYQTDISENMLRFSKKGSRRFFSRDHFLCANAAQIPLSDNSIDLVFSSLMLQWCQNLDAVFAEVVRVLKSGGVFVFSSFGPDTLYELRESWRQVDSKTHVNAFVDMHDVGDALVRAGLDAPVLNTERITLTFDDCWQLMRELKKIGASNVNQGRSRALSGKGKLNSMIQHYEHYRKDNKLPATDEVVYGHAWTTEHNINKDPGKQTISLEQLKQDLQNRRAD